MRLSPVRTGGDGRVLKLHAGGSERILPKAMVWSRPTQYAQRAHFGCVVCSLSRKGEGCIGPVRTAVVQLLTLMSMGSLLAGLVAYLLPRARLLSVTLLVAIGFGSALWPSLYPRGGSTISLLILVPGTEAWRLVIQVMQLAVLFVLVLALLRALLARVPAPIPRSALGVVSAVLLMWAALLLGELASPNGGMDPRSLVFPGAVVAYFMLPALRVETLLATVRAPLVFLIYGSIAAGLLAPDWALGTTWGESILRPLGPRLVGLTTHPNSLGAAAVVFVLLGLPGRSRWEWVHRIAGALVILWTGSLTAWAAGSAALAVLAYSRLGGATRISLRLGLSALMVALLFLAGLLALAELSAEDQARLATGTGRTQLWELTWDRFLERPVFGHGSALFREGGEVRQVFGWAGQAHNQLLDTLVRSGLVGGAALLFYLVMLVRLVRSSRSAMAAALFAVFLVRGVSESPVISSGVDVSSFLHIVTLVMIVRSSKAQGRSEGLRAEGVSSPARGAWPVSGSTGSLG